MTPELHPDVVPLRALLGTWRGPGAGEYPTIESFGYLEEVTFGHVGKPFLAYSQKTRHAESGLPMHAETGYWRLIGGRDLEVVIMHPTGIVELQIGQLSNSETFDLTSSTVVGTPTAKEVTEVHRHFEIVGDELRYEVSMAAASR